MDESLVNLPFNSGHSPDFEIRKRQPQFTLPINGVELNWVNQLPSALSNATVLSDNLQAKPGELLADIFGVARYRVSNGRRIEVALLSDGKHSEAEYYLMATPFGALIHQRGELPLHASAVKFPHSNHALLIAGDSGAGKSTLAAAFTKRGWPVLNDDVSRVSSMGDKAVVWPGFAALKLWKRSCDILNLDNAALPRVRGIKEKYLWQPPIHSEPLPIAALVELGTNADGGQTINIQRQSGSKIVRLLLRQTFRSFLVKPLGCQTSHFMQIQQVAKQFPCYLINNNQTLSPDSLIDRLEELFAKPV